MTEDQDPEVNFVGTVSPTYPALLAVMTVEQVAAYLQVSKRTIYNMAQAGEIPAAKVGEQWRFFRPEVDRWLSRLSRAHVGEQVEPEGEAE